MFQTNEVQTTDFRLPTTSKTKTFREVEAWQLAHTFVLRVYQYTDRFPKKEMFSLTSQFRRAAISIAANICEGYKRKSKKDKLRFYNISQGSLEECRYYLILSKDLKYGDPTPLEKQLEKTSKKLHAYMQAIRKILNIFQRPTVYCDSVSEVYGLPSSVFRLPTTDY
ncbi:MAG: four helix bundle protein [Candidatus Marinimicrobia bacterium]|nr:four helix bundle protein [Candidatus Neomarinimicrobiota bacterium]